MNTGFFPTIWTEEVGRESKYKTIAMAPNKVAFPFHLSISLLQLLQLLVQQKLLLTIVRHASVHALLQQRKRKNKKEKEKKKKKLSSRTIGVNAGRITKPSSPKIPLLKMFFFGDYKISNFMLEKKR
jgi:hypothetical protein